MKGDGSAHGGQSGQVRSLSAVAEVLPGLSTGARLEHDPTGTVHVVLSRHLTHGLPYRFNQDDTFRITPDRETGKYEVRQGDVLFMSRGTRNVATVIEAVPDPTVAPVSFYIVRPSPSLDPTYLMWYLNQPTAQRAVSDVRTGAGTPIVQRSAFMEMEIPIPELGVQRAIGRIGIAMAREKRAMEQLSAATERLHDLINERLARSLERGDASGDAI